MSRIAIVADDTATARTLVDVARVTGTGISRVREAIVDGVPVHEALWFMNDHEDVADRLYRLIGVLRQNDNDFPIYGLREDEAFKVAPKVASLIDESILTNILVEWDRLD